MLFKRIAMLCIACGLFFSAQAAINTSPSNFLKKIVAGEHVNMVVIGSSRSCECCTVWPTILYHTLDSLFPGKITYTNLAYPNMGALYVKEKILDGTIAKYNPDLITIETAYTDFYGIQWYGCDPTCSNDQVTFIIDTLQQMYPNLSILYFITQFLAPPQSNDDFLQIVANYRALADQKNLHLVDILDQASALPYDEYMLDFPDGNHAGDKGSRELIVPPMLNAIWGVGDPTPPTQRPTGLTLVMATDRSVHFGWTALSADADSQSGIAGYAIMRNNVKIGVSPVNSYTDSSVKELTTYIYQVSGVNGSGVLGPKSDSLSATTLGDQTAPTITFVKAVGLPATKVMVLFSEPVDPVTAQDSSKYVMESGIVVHAAEIQPGGKSVRLTTSALSEGQTYTLTVSGIKDIAHTPNACADILKTFVYSQYAQGLAFSYYEVLGSATQIPDFNSMSSVLTGSVSSPTPSIALRQTLFGLRFEGYIDVPADGRWYFYLTSIDGTRLYIDNNQIAANDRLQTGFPTASGNTTLSATRHTFRLDYFYGDGSRKIFPFIGLKWRYTGTTDTTAIPDSLFHFVPVETAPGSLKIVVLSPEEKALYAVNDTLHIHWANNLGDNRALNIKISFDNGIDWRLLNGVGGVGADQQSFDWPITATWGTIPTTGNQVYVQVEDYLLNENNVQVGPFAISDSVAIKGKINKNRPVSGFTLSTMAGNIQVKNSGHKTLVLNIFSANGKIKVHKQVAGHSQSIVTRQEIGGGVFLVQVCQGARIVHKKVVFLN